MTDHISTWTPTTRIHRAGNAFVPTPKSILIGLLVATTGLAAAGCRSESPDTTSPSSEQVNSTASSYPVRQNTMTLPEHFGVAYDASGVIVSDCRVTGSDFRCAIPGDPLAAGIISSTAEITGTLSGLRMTGTKKSHMKAQSPPGSDCIIDQQSSGPVIYEFNADGTVAIREGPLLWQTAYRGGCPGEPGLRSETVLV